MGLVRLLRLGLYLPGAGSVWNLAGVKGYSIDQNTKLQ